MHLSILALLGGILIWSIVVDNPVVMYLIIAAIILYAWSAATAPEPRIKGFDRLKPYPCNWCNRAFWTHKGCNRHEETEHPTQKRKRVAYYGAQKQGQKHGNRKIHNPDNYLKPCTWCGGSGWKNGVMCDECGGTGKMFR